MRSNRWLAVLLVLLGSGVAASGVLGPLVTGTIHYRTSATTLNQIVGGDLAALLLVAPLSVAVAALAWRRHPAAPALALGPAVYALYIYAQLVVGQEYLALPGNSEHFFLLHLGVFLLAEAVLVLALGQLRGVMLPAVGRRDEKVASAGLLVIALFLVVGLHGPGLVDALGDNPTRLEYLSSPAAFWAVKLMDLGVVVPGAVGTAIGLMVRAPWATKAMYLIVSGYTLLSASVAGMAVVMYLRDDPDGSLGMALAFTAVSACLAVFTVHLYRPLLTGSGPGSASTTGFRDAGNDGAAAGRPRRAASAARR
jgi:hypothetical protein